MCLTFNRCIEISQDGDNTVSKTYGNFQMPSYKKLISEDMIHDIRKVAYFARSQYSQPEIAETLAFYTNRFVRQLFDFTSVNNNTVIVDVGAGFGWLSMAFVYSTKAQVIAIDANEARLAAGKQIANILGVGNKIDWLSGTLGHLPLGEQEADVVYCVEVLEHTNKSTVAVSDLCRVSKDLIILTTPNQWFPVIAHDTWLPFNHWLPIRMRRIYAKLFNRNNREYSNLFWSPFSLSENIVEFKAVSKWLHYVSYKKFKDTFPFYLPYGKGEYVKKLTFTKRLCYAIVSRFGIYSHWLLPSLSYVFRRSKNQS